ncbi:hypothetical protein O181_061193 [Austropuccinia psidii MF-1]|uniref:Uncharacterized protein n=1 Tax=Austropuccinia psidii MF-1 TaxID=1389203 RepID=A0A9Q3EHN5_9BASI|nr:hypothetical protein [Austropuccinia psidii MF-1]
MHKHLLVTQTKGMAYIHGKATKMNVCVENAQHPLIIDSGTHCSIVAREYLDRDFQNWKKQLFPNKANSFTSESRKVKYIGTILKEIIIPHREGNIRLNTEVLVLEYSHIQGFLLEKDYHKMYGIGIYNSKNRHIKPTRKFSFT